MQGLDAALQKNWPNPQKASLISNEKPDGVSEEQLLREVPSRRAKGFRIPLLLVESDTSTHGRRDFDGGRHQGLRRGMPAR